MAALRESGGYEKKTGPVAPFWILTKSRRFEMGGVSTLLGIYDAEAEASREAATRIVESDPQANPANFVIGLTRIEADPAAVKRAAKEAASDP